MKKSNLWMLVWALLVSTAFVACDDDDDEETDQDQVRVAAFFQSAAQSDMFEIATGTMAQSKGSHADVRTFGAMLVEDHTMSSEEIMTMAEERDITLSTTLPSAKAAIVTRLNGETGTTFDKDFATVQVQAHQEAITLYETANNEIMDTEVQAFIDATLPVLRMHLQHAQALKTTVDAM
jgi:putative membrane protein